MEDIEDDAVEATEGTAQVHRLEGDKDPGAVVNAITLAMKSGPGG